MILQQERGKYIADFYLLLSVNSKANTQHPVYSVDSFVSGDRWLIFPSGLLMHSKSKVIAVSGRRRVFCLFFLFVPSLRLGGRRVFLFLHAMVFGLSDFV